MKYGYSLGLSQKPPRWMLGPWMFGMDHPIGLGWNNWKSPQKGWPVEFKGGGKATGGARGELLKMLFRIAGSVAGGSVVPRVAAFGRNRWRSSSGHSADWFWERCPFLARKWGPSFVKILCPLYVSQLLRIFVYSSRAYVFFLFFCLFLGNANRFSRGTSQEWRWGQQNVSFAFKLHGGFID